MGKKHGRGRDRDDDHGRKDKDRRDHDRHDDDHEHGHKGHSIQLILGTRRDDELEGTDRNDIILAGWGDDVVLGGAGNDLLLGDAGPGGWGWHFNFWGKPKGSFDDYLDGGAGSDIVLAGKGDDVVNYTLSENEGAKDYADGGKGFDTLRLTLTSAELQLASVQEDIARFEAFLDKSANAHGGHGKTFQFQSFDLVVRNFEALEYNRPPVAQNDSFSLDEDTVLIVPGPGVLANDSDPEGSPLTLEVVAGPTHGTLTPNAGGSFEYEPDANFNGSDSFTYRVNDGELDSNVATVTLTIAPVNDAPVAADDAASTDEDTPVVLDLLANDTDVDGDALAAIIVDGPQHGALALNPDDTYTYTPDANFFGTDTFTYRASDGSPDTSDASLATVSLTINPVNDLPVAVDDAALTDEDSAIGGNVLANDTDVEDGRPVLVGSVNGSAANVGATITLASGALLTVGHDGSFGYDPNGQFESLGNEIASDEFTYIAQDSEGANSNAARVTISIMGVNDAPVAGDDAFSITEDPATPLSGQVLGNDTDVEGDALTAAVVADPSHGLLSLNPDGTFTYTPDADFFGEDVFTYRASDGDLSDVAAVTITVTPVNDPPVAVGDSFTTDEDEPLSGNVLDNDVDVEGDTLTATLVDGPSNGTLDFQADGSFTYTPDADYFGPDGFTYRANDGQVDSEEAATVDLTVVPVNDPPVANDDVIEPEAGPTGPIRVAVVGAIASINDGVVAQLNDSIQFSIQATSILISATQDLDFWRAQFADYDAVVTGEDGVGLVELEGTPIFAALSEFLDQGGGVVTPGLFAGYAFDGSADAEKVSPVDQPALTGVVAVPTGSLITAVPTLDTAGEAIMGGLSDYAAQGNHEVAAAIDSTATLIATDSSGRAAIAYDEVGPGRTVYLGSLHMGDGSIGGDSARQTSTDPDNLFDVDQIFERAVNWAAGDLSGSAAVTDEDTPYTILAAAVLANDTDIDNDHADLSVSAVSATSALGASVSIDETTGDIHYDPTIGLNHLAAGEIVEDSFEYTVSDGNGGFDAATVTLTVEGRNDAPDAVNDARFTDESTAISGNVLANDSDAEGDVLTVSNPGSLTTAHGAQVTLGADGSYTYDPRVSAELQALSSGQNVVDSFEYAVSDGNGGTDTAIANVTVAGRSESGGGTTSNQILPQVSPGSNLEYYVRFEGSGIDPDWLLLEGFELGAENNILLGSKSGGAGAGRVSFEDVQLTLGSSAALVQLTGALAAGKALTEVEIEAYRHGGGGELQLVDEYRFDQVLLSGLQTDGTPDSTSESLSFNFTKISYTHLEQDKAGAGSKTSMGYDVAKAQSTSGVGASPEAVGNLPAAGLPVDADLTYYVTYEDAPGWLELSGFEMSLSVPSTSTSGSTRTAGAVKLDDVQLQLGSSAQLVELFGNLTTGKHLEFLEVEAYRHGKGGELQLVDEYYFDTVFLDSLQTANASDNTLGLTAGRFSHGHIEYDATGKASGSVDAGWDFLSNTPFTHGSPDADLL